MVQPELEKTRSPLVSIPPFRAEIFKALGLSIRWWVRKQRKRLVPALPIIVSMSPPSYPSAWLHPCRARLRFTGRSHC